MEKTAVDNSVCLNNYCVTECEYQKREEGWGCDTLENCSVPSIDGGCEIVSYCETGLCPGGQDNVCCIKTICCTCGCTPPYHKQFLTTAAGCRSECIDKLQTCASFGAPGTCP